METLDMIIIFLIGSIIILSLVIYVMSRKISNLRAKLESKNIYAMRNQRNKLKGEISQQWSPILPDFPVTHASDVFHFGGVIDFIAFEGISKDQIEKIWFIDSKYNKSQLSKSQKQIKQIIDALNKLRPDLIEFSKYNPKKGAELAFKRSGLDIELE